MNFVIHPEKYFFFILRLTMKTTIIIIDNYSNLESFLSVQSL